MNQHPYLRAYMAGIAVPTAILLVWLTGYCVLRFAYNESAPIERALVFPMAVVPNVFGAWNMLFVKLHQLWRVPIGLHGAALPLFLGPIAAVFNIGMGFARVTDRGVVLLDVLRLPWWYVVLIPFLAIALYYLIWKYLVGFLNKLLGIGD